MFYINKITVHFNITLKLVISFNCYSEYVAYNLVFYETLRNRSAPRILLHHIL
eukprot:UN12194